MSNVILNAEEVKKVKEVINKIDNRLPKNNHIIYIRVYDMDHNEIFKKEWYTDNVQYEALKPVAIIYEIQNMPIIVSKNSNDEWMANKKVNGRETLIRCIVSVSFIVNDTTVYVSALNFDALFELVLFSKVMSCYNILQPQEDIINDQDPDGYVAPNQTPRAVLRREVEKNESFMKVVKHMTNHFTKHGVIKTGEGKQKRTPAYIATNKRVVLHGEARKRIVYVKTKGKGEYIKKGGKYVPCPKKSTTRVK